MSLSALFILGKINRQDARRQKVFKKMQRLKRLDFYRSQLMLKQALALNEADFIAKYRLSKALFQNLVDLVVPYLKPVPPTEISIKCKVLIALSFYVTGSYPSKHYNTYISRQTARYIMQEVTLAINHRSTLNAHVQFPQTLAARNMTKAKFEKEYNMSSIIGCIHTCQIAITKPKENPAFYSNGDNTYSTKFQIVSDYDLNIMHVDASFGGSVDDESIFNRGCVNSRLAKMNAGGEPICILGDSNFAQRVYMMTPIKHAFMWSCSELLYNKMHALARNRVDRTLCLLKARWRCLMANRPLNYHPGMVWSIINACCVLHNMCNKARLFPSPNMPVRHMLLDLERPNGRLQVASLTRAEIMRGYEARQRMVDMLQLRQINNSAYSRFRSM